MSRSKKKTDVIPPLIVVGDRLRRARNAKRMSVEKLAKVSRISSRYINDMESGNFSTMPGRTYVIGFTTSICKTLGLDHGEIIQIIRSELYHSEGTTYENDPSQGIKSRSLLGWFKRKR